MPGIFPQQDWLDEFAEYLNSSEKYSRVARKWEGATIFEVKAEGPLENDVAFHLDLWHGKCRSARMLVQGELIEADFVFTAPYNNFVRVLTGDLDPMQAMLTRKLVVSGSMGYLMRNIPTVLEFVRCAKEVTDGVVEI